MWAVPIGVRTGLHTGPGRPERGDYFGPTVNRAAASPAPLIQARYSSRRPQRLLLEGWTLRDLGEHNLRGIGPMRLQQVLVTGLPSEFPSLATALLVVDLPSPNTTLVGRAADVEAVGQLIDSHRLVTLAGAGGCGKTRLAIEVAGRLAARFPDGVRFVDLATVTDSTQVADVVVRTLGLADDPTGADPLGRLSSYLADRAVLCVVDNCEHVLDVSATLSEAILARPGRTVLLATSREPLGILGEQTYVVPSLDFDTDAVRLFADRAANRVLTSASTPRSETRSPRSASASMAFRWPSSSPRRGSGTCHPRSCSGASMTASAFSRVGADEWNGTRPWPPPSTGVTTFSNRLTG